MRAVRSPSQARLRSRLRSQPCAAPPAAAPRRCPVARRPETAPRGTSPVRGVRVEVRVRSCAVRRAAWWQRRRRRRSAGRAAAPSGCPQVRSARASAAGRCAGAPWHGCTVRAVPSQRQGARASHQVGAVADLCRLRLCRHHQQLRRRMVHLELRDDGGRVAGDEQLLEVVDDHLVHACGGRGSQIKSGRARRAAHGSPFPAARG